MTSRVAAGIRAVAVVLALAAGAPVSAQGGGGWQYEVTPYLWMSGMKGSVQAGSLPKTNVDMKFGDILEVLDFGVMGAFEARRGRWGLLFDGMYMKVSDSAVASRPVGPGVLTVNANARLQQTMLGGAAAYRVSEGSSAVDVIGGLRYSRMEVDATIDGTLFVLAGRVARSGDKDWVDPYIGLRVRAPVAPRWTIVGYGDIGGFGIGSDSAWQAAIGAEYEFSKTTVAKFGFRAIGVDYDRGGFVYDMRTQGLYLGVGMRF